MITHEEAKELVDKIYVHTDWDTKDKLLDYITQQEQFAKDVARYFELFMNRKRTIQESTEMLDLFVKLSKVGKKSE